ncbi:MAG: hypothetical protein AAF791_10365 [Bacteroidota bacterium]
MTQLLQDAVARLKRLPTEDQERYARQILDALDGDAHWDQLFARTSDAQWAALTREARQDADENGTLSLDELKATL